MRTMRRGAIHHGLAAMRTVQACLALLVLISFLLPMFQVPALKGLGMKNPEVGNGISMLSLSNALQQNVAKAIRKAKLPEGVTAPLEARFGAVQVAAIATTAAFACAILAFAITYGENLGVARKRNRRWLLMALSFAGASAVLLAAFEFRLFAAALHAQASTSDEAFSKLTKALLGSDGPPALRVGGWAYVAAAGFLLQLVLQACRPDGDMGKRPSMLWFALPIFLLYTAFVIGPALSSIYLGFTSWDGITDASMRFIGLDNYRNIFASARFWSAAKNTLLIAAAFTVFVNLIALALAMAVDRARFAKNIFRSAFYLPVLISGVVAGFIWKIMFNYSFGVINHVLQNMGLASMKFLDVMPNALISIVGVLLWQSSGYYMIIYLAALQGVPVELLEAARIDGANGRQAFWHVTLPMLAGSFTINLTLALINGMKIFDQIAVMTDGGPGFSTETITYMIYKVAFGEMRQGFGTALAVLLFLIIMVFGGIQVTLLRKREVQL